MPGPRGGKHTARANIALNRTQDVFDADDVFVPAKMPQQLEFAQQQLTL